MVTDDVAFIQQLDPSLGIKIAGSEKNDPPPPSADPIPEPNAGNEPAPNPPKQETTPAKEPNNQPPASEAVINDEIRLKVLNETLGTSYASLSEISGLNLNESVKELPDLRRVKQEYDKLSKSKPAKFYNDNIKELNVFAEATGIDDASVLRRLKQFQNTTNPDPVDAMVLARIAEDPSLIEKADLLRKSIIKNYHITTEEDADHDSESSELEKFRMDQDGKAAGKKISELMEKVKNMAPEVNDEAEAKKTEQVRSTWKQTFDDVAPKIFTKIPIYLPKGEGQAEPDIAAELELKPEDVARYTALAYNDAVNNGLEPTAENRNRVAIDIIKEIIADNIGTIASSIKEKAVSEARLKFEQEVHNPSGIKKETPTDPNAKVDQKTEVFEAVMKELKG